ncbi:MAG: hypothetical protein ACRDBO_16750 [Lachnospiraceae bacterium]
MKRKQEDENIRRYLEGLRKYCEQGIPIMIDGVESEPADWEGIFQVRDDGSFYMGDYILSDEKGENQVQGKLKEIRFDKVYYK